MSASTLPLSPEAQMLVQRLETLKIKERALNEEDNFEALQEIDNEVNDIIETLEDVHHMNVMQMPFMQEIIDQAMEPVPLPSHAAQVFFSQNRKTARPPNPIPFDNEDIGSSEDEMQADDVHVFVDDPSAPVWQKDKKARCLKYYSSVTGEEDKTKTVQQGAQTPNLQPHQMAAIDHCLQRYMKKQGSMICHAMGLGKTLTAYSLINQIAEASSYKLQTILLCPKSLLKSWQHEFSKWFFPNVVLLEPCTQSSFFDDALKELHNDLHASKMIVLPMTFDILAANIEKMGEADVKIDLVVIDEVHQLKNNATQRTAAVQCLHSHSNAVVIALTGTPVQNSPLDMFTMMNIVQPDVVGSMQNFKQLLHEASKKEDVDEKALALHYNYIYTKASEIMHRQDASVLEAQLPPKQEFSITFDGQLDVDDGEIDPKINPIQLQCKILNDSHYVRMSLVLDLIQTCDAKKEPVLVFSQRVKFLEDCKRNVDGLFLNGLNSNKAQELVDRFQDPASTHNVFYISTHVGCGITLTRATRVILADPSWNPMDDLQALHRVYRFGQTKPVTVYRFVCGKSIEVRIKRQQAFKMAAAGQIVDDSRALALFSTEERTAHDPDAQGMQESALNLTHCEPILRAFWDKNADQILHVVDSTKLISTSGTPLLRADIFAAQQEYNLRLFYSSNFVKLGQQEEDSPETLPICAPPLISSLETYGQKIKLNVRTRPFAAHVLEFRWTSGDEENMANSFDDSGRTWNAAKNTFFDDDDDDDMAQIILPRPNPDIYVMIQCRPYNADVPWSSSSAVFMLDFVERA
jgi:SNF2 family DNA or RNA helicase